MDADSAVRVVKIFVSSPVDVAPERGRVQAVTAKLNRDYDGTVRFDTVLWEDHFYKADRSFQPQIQRPDACDILVSIFWTRVGTELPTDFARMPNGKPYPSGTAYELLTALEASKEKGLPDVYVFRKTADATLPTADTERRRQAETHSMRWRRSGTNGSNPNRAISRLRFRPLPPPTSSNTRSKNCCGNGCKAITCSVRV